MEEIKGQSLNYNETPPLINLSMFPKVEKITESPINVRDFKTTKSKFSNKKVQIDDSY